MHAIERKYPNGKWIAIPGLKYATRQSALESLKPIVDRRPGSQFRVKIVKEGG